MNALTRILMNVVRAYNAEQLLKLLKIAQMGTETLGAGVYFDKESKEYMVFFVRDGQHLKRNDLHSPDEDAMIAKAESFAIERCDGNTCVAAGLGTCDDPKCEASQNKPGEQDSGQLQGIDRHDDPFYDTGAGDSTYALFDNDTSDADDVREHSQEVDVDVDVDAQSDIEVRECTDEDRDEDGPKIKRGRKAQRRAKKRKGNKVSRGYNAQPSSLLGKMFERSPETLAD